MNLENIAIFSDLGHKDIEQLLRLMGQRECHKGETLFVEGDAGDEMYILVSGAVSILVKLPDDKELVLSEIKAGNFFGEMSIIERAPRSATCRALEDSALLSFHADDFHQFAWDFPMAGMKIMKRMLEITASRLLTTGSLLSEMVQWGEASRKRAITDPATGLFNRRYLEDSFASLVNQSQLNKQPITFVMFDMDRFGSLNTKYGLEFGDKIIVEASKTFRAVFGSQDILVRYGGDEFLFLFPGADSKMAQEKCDALCQAVRDLRFPEHEELRITCSMGFATFPDQAKTPDELKEKADKALYLAKEKGRDRAQATQDS